MSDSEKKIIQWADLDSYKKLYIESMEDGLGRTWLWMYFSGYSVEDIAAEYSFSKTRVFVSLKVNIEKYNQFFCEEREKAAQIQTTFFIIFDIGWALFVWFANWYFTSYERMKYV